MWNPPCASYRKCTYTQTSVCDLHRSLALVLSGAAAQEDHHGEDDHQESRSGDKHDEIDAAIRRFVPGGVRCDEQNAKQSEGN